MSTDVRGQVRNVEDVLRLMGVEHNNVLVCNSFVQQQRGGRVHSSALVVDDELDAYLVQLGVHVCHDTASSPTVLTTPLLPGAREYYQSLGFNFNLVEASNPNGARRGDPAHYLLKCGNGAKECLPQDALLYSSFLSHELMQLGRPLHGHTANVFANSKIAMTRGSHYSAFRIPDSQIIGSMSDLRVKKDEFKYPLYLKADGSGSDLVVKVDHPRELAEKAKGLARLVATALGHPPPAEDDEEDLDRFPLPIVAQQDVCHYGEVVANVCCHYIVGKEDIFEVGYSRQLFSPDGEWWGGEGIDLDEETRTAIRGEVIAFGRWLQSVGYQGMIGPDVMVVRWDGDLVAFIIDPNGRPAISSYSMLLGNSFQKGWASTNVVFLNPIQTIEEFRSYVEPVERNTGVNVILMASRSEPDNPRRTCKVTILGDEEGRASALKIFSIISSSARAVQ